MPLPYSAHNAAKPGGQAVTKNDYLALAGFLLGSESTQRVYKRDPNGEAVRATAELYGKREYVPAYERFKPAYEKVVSDMQRVLARNVEFEANKLAQKQHVSLGVAKERVQNIRGHAQQVIDQFDRLLRDLESKPLVRAYIKKGGIKTAAVEPPVEEPSPTILNSANETWVEAAVGPPLEVVSGDCRYAKAPYAPPEPGSLYSVRDKVKGERIIRIIAISSDGALVQVEILEDGKPLKQPIQLAVDSLARQAAKGWCSLLVPIVGNNEAAAGANQPADADSLSNVTMRLDSQNFGRCCGDIIRAGIKFGTQPIKDVADGPFRAGNYEQAFLTFEQLAVGFNAAVANSRRAIADGRRALTSEKVNLSGKEIQDRTAGFVRSENLIHTAEREFATILEGLRMYLRARSAPENQGESG
jgi:hypothetical protein